MFHFSPGIRLTLLAMVNTLIRPQVQQNVSVAFPDSLIINFSRCPLLLLLGSSNKSFPAKRYAMGISDKHGNRSSSLFQNIEKLIASQDTTAQLLSGV